MRFAIVMGALALASCGPTPEQQAADDEQARAEVEAAQQPPPEKLVLDPIRYREIEKYGLYGAGCSFVPDGGGLGAVAIAMADDGYMIRNGELLHLSADKGSEELPYLARSRYDGLTYSFTLDLDEESGEKTGMETSDYRGELTVRDGSENIVYQANGLTQCGA